MQNYTEILSYHLEKWPRLHVFLGKICTRYNKKGALTGTMKLGNGLDYLREEQPLVGLFGASAVASRKNGDVILSFDRYFHSWNQTSKEKWIDSLFRVLTIERVNPIIEFRSQTQKTRLILDRLRLKYPQHPALHEYMVTREIYWERQRLLRGTKPLQDVLEIAFDITEYLLGNQSNLTLSTLGAKFCGDSKALRKGELYNLIGDMLIISLNEGRLDAVSRKRVFSQCGVITNPTPIKVTLFGPLIYRKKDQIFDWIKRLWEAGETATLSLDNLSHIESVTIPNGESTKLTTCENESPFCDLVRERYEGTIVYTEGYPNTAVEKCIEYLSANTKKIHHWGDSDPDGLFIASLFTKYRPVVLWRCSLEDLKRLTDKLEQLSPEKMNKGRKILQENPSFPFPRELNFTLDNGWLEQEKWEKIGK